MLRIEICAHYSSPNLYSKTPAKSSIHASRLVLRSVQRLTFNALHLEFLYSNINERDLKIAGLFASSQHEGSRSSAFCGVLDGHKRCGKNILCVNGYYSPMPQETEEKSTRWTTPKRCYLQHAFVRTQADMKRIPLDGQTHDGPNTSGCL